MKNRHLGSDFDDFLSEHGLLADAEAIAMERVLAFEKAKGTEEARDEWERQLLGIAKNCGVSLSDSDVSSEGLYE